ncbi:MAG: aminoglycoside phosphotransferase family protein [Oligoflexales bacterium]
MKSKITKIKHNSQDAILKAFDGSEASDETNSSRALEIFSGRSCVRLLKRESRSQILEYVDGPSLLEMTQQGHDDESITIMAKTLNKLHMSSDDLGSIQDLPTLREFFSALYHQAKEAPSSIFGEGAHMADKLLATEQDKRVLHGDMHHENVLLSKERGWLAIDPKGVFGERTYDGANIFLNPKEMPELVEDEDRLGRVADILAQEMNLDRSRLLRYAFVHCCLSASWSIEDGEDARLALRVGLMLKSLASL